MKIVFCTNHSNRYVVNKKYKLCLECNHQRIHGESVFDSKRKSYLNNQKDKKKKSVKKVSEKQKSVNELYIEVCKKIDSERESKCSGCGLFQGGEIILSHSHIISRDDCRKIGRIELIYEEENIVFHCLDFMNHVGCHRVHESKNSEKMKNLLDYDTNLNFVKSISEELYLKLVK